MNSSLILAKAHGGMAMLLVLLASLSLALALKAIASSGERGSGRVANIAGLVETIVAGIVTLTGIVLMFVSPWPLSQAWIWIGLVIMVMYSILLKRCVKPARLATAEGESAMRWAGFQGLLLLLLIVGFALMRVKPF